MTDNTSKPRAARDDIDFSIALQEKLPSGLTYMHTLWTGGTGERLSELLLAWQKKFNAGRDFDHYPAVLVYDTTNGTFLISCEEGFYALSSPGDLVKMQQCGECTHHYTELEYFEETDKDLCKRCLRNTREGLEQAKELANS